MKIAIVHDWLVTDAGAEKVLKAIFENVADGVIVVDPDTKQFQSGNKKICEMLGYTLEEVKNAALKANDNTRTMGVALSPCILPATGKPNFTISDYWSALYTTGINSNRRTLTFFGGGFSVTYAPK